MPRLTRDQRLANARRALARATEPAGKVETTTARLASSAPKPKATPKNAPNYIGKDESTIIGESSTREEYDRPEPQQRVVERVPRSSRTPRVARSNPIPRNAVGTPVDPDAEPIELGGQEIHGPSPRQRGKPPNYKLHVLTALLLAGGIRVLKYGTKALTG